MRFIFEVYDMNGVRTPGDTTLYGHAGAGCGGGGGWRHGYIGGCCLPTAAMLVVLVVLVGVGGVGEAGICCWCGCCCRWLS